MDSHYGATLWDFSVGRGGRAIFFRIIKRGPLYLIYMQSFIKIHQPDQKLLKKIYKNPPPPPPPDPPPENHHSLRARNRRPNNK